MNLLEWHGYLAIDKTEVDALLAAKNFVGLNRSPRTEKIIVSLTSYAPRINDVKYALYSLLNQTFPPDKLILWLDEDSFPRREENLPRELLELKAFGLSIDWCENLRPYKKFVPALEKYPDAVIVTADDDIFYRPDWLKVLYDEHLNSPDYVVAHYPYRVQFSVDREIYPFKKWSWLFKPVSSSLPAFGNFFGNGGGALLKKSFLHADVLNREKFLSLSPLDDDVWLWAMAVLNGTKIKVPLDAHNKIIYVDIDTQQRGETLWAHNKNHRDEQICRVMENYPALVDALIREDAESTPYISIVFSPEPQSEVVPCLEKIFRQNFPDFELIFVNRDRQMKFTSAPTNFRMINYPGGSLCDALNLGLRRAAGEYILFLDEILPLPRDVLEIITQLADISRADVIHFASPFQAADEIFSDSDAPLLFDVPKQQRAVAWLQNKLSKRLDTKIFRRDFLTKHGLIFGDDPSEFMFRALIQAEDYLLVPQNLCFIKE